MARKYHKDGISPDNVVFVFGSNLAGRHGAGAARAAALHYGAEYGKGHGRMPFCYAIPTKDYNINTLELDVIKFYVKIFIRHASTRPQEEFLITRIGCGLAGYKDSDIAPMFKNAPDNCSFAEEWRQYLEE